MAKAKREAKKEKRLAKAGGKTSLIVQYLVYGVMDYLIYFIT